MSHKETAGERIARILAEEETSERGIVSVGIDGEEVFGGEFAVLMIVTGEVEEVSIQNIFKGATALPMLVAAIQNLETLRGKMVDRLLEYNITD